MTIELIKAPTDADWMFVKRCTLITVGREPITPPTGDWKRKLLRAGHSPIRELRFAYLITGVPYWVSTHLARHHVGCQPYIRTQRNDRQDAYDRTEAPQGAPVDMIWTLNAEALITIAHKRLCNQASPETREVVRRMCALAEDAVPELDGLLVPMCAYLGGRCPEMNPCGRE